MPTEERLLAISGDLVGSRKIIQRIELYAKLESELPALARKFEPHWVAVPQMTRGLDEFSAAMNSAEPLFAFLVALNEAIWPHRFRLGVGIGSLDLGRETGNAARLDGPAFHLAAEAIADARQSGRPLVIRTQQSPCSRIRAIEALAEAHAALMQKWTKSSAQMVPLMRVSEHQREVASTLGVTQQVVSKALIRAHYKTLLSIEDAATALLAGEVLLAQGGDNTERSPDGP